MIKQRYVIPLLIALSLGAAPLLAQTTSAEKPSSAEPASNSTSKSGSTQEAPAPQEPTNKSAAPAAGNDSPFDYRSSEQISEDVPVSFPVDI